MHIDIAKISRVISRVFERWTNNSVMLLLAFIGAVVALSSLIASSGNSALLGQYYTQVLYLNVGLSALMLVFVLGLSLRLIRQYRAKKFGAQLTGRFTASFAAMSLIPGILMYVISAFFLYQSIESWFNVRVQTALNAGLSLSRAILTEGLNDLRARGQYLPAELQAQPAQTKAVLATFTARNPGHLAILQPSKTALSASPINITMLNQDGYFAWIDTPATGLDEAQVWLQVAYPMGANVLLVSQPVAQRLAAQVLAVENGFKDYESLALGRKGLRKIYAASLTLAMMITLLLSIGVGFLIAKALVAPLLTLAQATQALAQGEFKPLAVRSSKGDLAVLTHSFNSMTAQLSQAQMAQGQARAALEQSNAQLEQILSTMRAGLVMLNPAGQVVTLNLAAQRLCPDVCIGAELPTDFLALLQTQAQSSADAQPQWQAQLERRACDDGTQTLLLYASAIDLAQGQGVLLVFDDISDFLLAQRSLAWGEVARRMAHEIKNPLTPIQLSAERLNLKLGQKLAQDDAALLKRATDTIVTQVGSLKRMVDEFRNYARLPQAQLQHTDLHQLIQDISILYTAANDTHRTVRLRLEATQPWLELDAGQIRQVIHNLVSNALDASSEAARAEGVQIVLSTRDGQHNDIVFAVEDNGAGFSAAQLNKVFEPYQTTKAKGTGLGLAIVKRIAQEHHAKLSVHNIQPASAADQTDAAPRGARIELRFTRTQAHAAASTQSRLL